MFSLTGTQKKRKNRKLKEMRVGLADCTFFPFFLYCSSKLAMTNMRSATVVCDSEHVFHDVAVVRMSGASSGL